MTTRQAQRHAKRLVGLCRINGALDEQRVREVVGRVVTARRRGWILTVNRFRRLVRLDQAARRAEVASATPLPPDLRAEIEHSLTSQYGPRLTITFSIDRALLAGVRVRVASDEYDGSLRGRLAQLQAAM